MLRIYIFFVVCLLFCFATDAIENEKCIEIEKRNVLYKFVPNHKWMDFFVQNLFKSWEEDTFDVFEKVKDKHTIAIDIGAWIGATTIWLSKNFAYVIAIEPDKDSVECLRKNLEASDCKNVKICTHPLDKINNKVVFGPRFGNLNESVSHIKREINNSNDYYIESIVFDDFINEYIYKDEKIKNRISFIKCDIEGGEEEILEDLLNFAYQNNCKIYISFHLKWWKSKKITDFENLFKNFNVDSSIDCLSTYILKNPFCSILFEPKSN